MSGSYRVKCENNMKSRQYFVQQVAQMLKDNHADGDESFIFGISGKWGEGKTHFLKALEAALKESDPSFEVYWINPWKFATDKISFLRNFLRIIYQKPVEWAERLVNYIFDRDNISILDADTTRNRINVGWLLATVVFLIILVWLYIDIQNGHLAINASVRDFIINRKWLASLVLLPIFLALVGQVITTAKTDHAFSTLDRFDDLLNISLAEAKRQKHKLVVFVDDLDRVTPGIARDVLDNLRTFFDKKDLSFVVTGDHTVLERYLGKDLLPDAKPPEQREEGRRFLKKIFNFYWHLPQPIDTELDEFLDGEFTSRASSLASIFKNPAEQESFKSYLRKYFDKNFRQIIRFIDTVAFTFQIIENKLKTVSLEEKKYLEELPENPLLVIRVLMIQELCVPLFDAIVNNRQLLADLEYAAETKNSARIDELLNPFRDELSPFQNNFIRSFIYEEPHFFRRTSLIVSDIRPFLYLAADASFGDSRGPSSDDFMKIMATGDPAQVKDALLSTGDEKAREAAKAFVAYIPTINPSTAPIGSLKTLLTALLEIPKEYSIHKIFAEELSKLDYSFIQNHPVPQEKMDILKLLWGWLDALDSIATEPFVNKFPFSGNIEFDPIVPGDAGSFTVKMLAQWLHAYYPQNPIDALNKMINLFGAFKKDYIEIIKSEVANLQDGMADDLIRDPTPAYRDLRLTFLKEYTPTGISILLPKLGLQIEALNSDIFQWSTSKVAPDTWSKEATEDYVINKLSSANDFNSMHPILNFIISQQIQSPRKIWKKISDAQLDVLVENFPAIIDSPYQPIAPPEETAQTLMEKLIEKIKTVDEGRKIQLIPCLRKEKWPWINLKKPPTKTRFTEITRSENEQLKNTLTEALTTWGK